MSATMVDVTLEPEAVVWVMVSPGFGTKSERVSEDAIDKDAADLVHSTVSRNDAICVSQTPFSSMFIEHLTIEY
jgi:hypothetical protein